MPASDSTNTRNATAKPGVVFQQPLKSLISASRPSVSVSTATTPKAPRLASE